MRLKERRWGMTGVRLILIVGGREGICISFGNHVVFKWLSVCGDGCLWLIVSYYLGWEAFPWGRQLDSMADYFLPWFL